jgi:hypothetical protein
VCAQHTRHAGHCLLHSHHQHNLISNTTAPSGACSAPLPTLMPHGTHQTNGHPATWAFRQRCWLRCLRLTVCTTQQPQQSLAPQCLMTLGCKFVFCWTCLPPAVTPPLNSAAASTSRPPGTQHCTAHSTAHQQVDVSTAHHHFRAAQILELTCNQ